METHGNKDSDQQKLIDKDTDTSQTVDFFIKPTRCNGCTFIVEPLFVFYTLIQNPVYIIMPQYIERREWEKLMGNETYPASSNSCVHHKNFTGNPIEGNLTLAGSATSYFNLQMMIASSIPSIIAVMFLGPYSDRVGRKFALLIPAFGQMLGMLVSFMVVFFHLPLEVFLIGSVIIGCTGNWQMFYAGTMSYITDVTTEKNRSFRMVVAEVCAGMSAVLSSAGSGYMLDLMGFTWVYFTLLIGDILIFLFVIFLIPETIRRDPHAKFFSLEYIKKAITTYAIDDETKRRWKMFSLLFSVFLFNCVTQVGIDTYFVINPPLCWGTVMVGVYSAVNYLVGMLGSGTSSKLLSYFLSDAWIGVIAIFLIMAGSIFKYFVVTTSMMFASTAFSVMYTVFTPTARSMASKLVQQDEIGAVLGGVAVVQVLVSMVSSASMNSFYSVTESAGHPSAVYLLMAAMLLVCLCIMIFYAIVTRKDNQKKEIINEVDVKT